MESSADEQLAAADPARTIARQLVLLSAAVALQVVAVSILVRLLLQRRGVERQRGYRVAEETEGLTAGAGGSDGDAGEAGSQRGAEGAKDLDPASGGDIVGGAIDSEAGPSSWLAPRHRVVCCCCFGGFICCTSDGSASRPAAELQTAAPQTDRVRCLACCRCRSNQHERRDRVDARRVRLDCNN
jgi:hypothetical protein